MTDTIQEPLDFAQAIELAMGLADFERSTHSPGHSTFHLERVRLLTESLQDVASAVPAVHVAGTKGKGSTSALITSILTHAGYKVGLFTSPHLHTVCERIRVGLEPISREEYASLIGQIWPDVELVGRNGGYGGVTFFEMMTALALVHFRNIGADFQVMEVGLGGRLDATNIVTPAVSVITSISLDHVATLGDTIRKIAREKAGIIKSNVPCVVAVQAESDAVEVFEQTAADRGAELTLIDTEYSFRQTSADLKGQSLYLKGPRRSYNIGTPLLGDYQLENVATAVAAVEVLEGSGVSIPPGSVEAGALNVRWPGRFQVYKRDGTTIVVDGAHNPYSVGRLIDCLDRYVSFDRVILVFGALGGHSAEGMLDVLAQLRASVVAVQSRHPRSARSSVTADAVRRAGLYLDSSFVTVAEGLNRAIEIARGGDLVLCTGSLALAAEAIEELEGIEPEIYDTLEGPVNRPLDAGNPGIEQETG